jgi:tetratricopeptide (TPR) repeat protein
MIELLLQAEGALSVGLLDRAEVLYQQVADADPRNSIAVVGLARVALERGYEVEALTFARRALIVDPQNNAASRMVQRLEEVLLYRGVAAPPPLGAPPSTGPADVGEAPAPLVPDPAGTPTAEPRSLRDRVFRRGKRP